MSGVNVEYGSIEREIYVDASPEVVFEVVSRPEHLREWWPDDAALDDSAPGGAGTLTFGCHGDESVAVVPLTVVESVPPRLFSFRWAYDPSLAPDRSNSFLVRIELVASGAGTTLRFTETGFREQGWTAAQQQFVYEDHATGWDYYLPRIAPYVADLKVRP
jgi:uncharacterized protein YndB with AHSA1/START domain